MHRFDFALIFGLHREDAKQFGLTHELRASHTWGTCRISYATPYHRLVESQVVILLRLALDIHHCAIGNDEDEGKDVLHHGQRPDGDDAQDIQYPFEDNDWSHKFTF